MFRFTIRDLLWLTILVAVLVVWWLEHRTYEQARLRDAQKIELLEKQAAANVQVIAVPTNWQPPRRPGGLRPVPGRLDYQAPPTRPTRIDAWPETPHSRSNAFGP